MEENQSLFELDIDHITSEELLDTAGWQKMFGILLITIIGLVLLAFIMAWDKIRSLINEAIAGESGQATMVVLIGVLLVIAGILGTMSWFLIRGAARIKSALRTKDQLVFNNGLSDLKTFFIIYGVLSILGLLGNLISLF
jgi:Ca2+/Na+ antiporter